MKPPLLRWPAITPASPQEPLQPLWRRLLWMAGIWVASIAVLVLGGGLARGAGLGGPDGQAEGKLARIYPLIENGRVVADVEVEGLTDRFVDARVLVRLPVGARQALVVPVAALQTFRDWTVVFVRVGETYEIRPVELGKRDAERVEVLSGLADGERVHGVSFTVQRGEILGIAGLMGAGRSELAQTLCGLRPATGGSVRLNGKALSISKYSDALRAGIAYLSEDRKAAGVYLDLPIAQNIASMALARVSSRFGLLQRAAEHRLAQELGARLKLKSDGVQIEVASLSGGNQQKVAIAKLLATNPAVLLMDEPTRGVDVGAKSEIHHILRDLACQGVGVVVISSELPEIIGLCDRALVIRDGRVAGEVQGKDMTEEALLRLASGLERQQEEMA